ncbi:hypothetical protein BC936DRAFT_147822 [Jimgerdemannia flammicorona]|uniref:Uncharacterized protein n=2 Tax=Jimgerdemannia flammicorona TaxID=994334 RepID=A0A433D4F9_9FUNG|nr:hypothetical protein BC936DRAFT_147822 [Jimgerdemannia flammicorona]RUS29236.1 hypothetical protein BC938DRAFT_480890 [Jimgerdemannia flammicorona]
MPKSKRIHASMDTYEYIWVYSIDHMRNAFLKDVRAEWNTSRFFFGRNKVIAKALGTTPEDEYKDGVSKLSDALVGNVGVFFTNVVPEEVKRYFAELIKLDYARSGVVASKTVVIPAGPVMRGEDIVPHNMEPQLRKLGMPITLNNGVVTLAKDYTVCKEGDTLTTSQAHLLRLFFHKLAEFRVNLVRYYHDGKVHHMDAMDEDA